MNELVHNLIATMKSGEYPDLVATLRDQGWLNLADILEKQNYATLLEAATKLRP